MECQANNADLQKHFSDEMNFQEMKNKSAG